MLTVIMRSNDGPDTYQFSDITRRLVETEAPFSTEEHELVQVEHYRELAKAKYPELAFEIDSIGANPPDFIIRRGEKLIQLDATAFSFGEKRGASIRFRTIKQAVIAAYRAGTLPGLTDIQFALQFPDKVVPGDTALKKVAIPEFLEALRRIGQRPWNIADFTGNWVDQVGPGGFPMDQQGVTSDNKIQWFVSGVGAVRHMYDNDFVSQCHFSIENLHQTTLTLADIHQRMFKLIDKHDQVAIEELLIIGGGPDKYGEGFADEASFASIAVKNLGSSLRSPKYLKRIVMHNWGSQTLDVIYEREKD